MPTTSRPTESSHRLGVRDMHQPHPTRSQLDRSDDPVTLMADTRRRQEQTTSETSPPSSRTTRSSCPVATSQWPSGDHTTRRPSADGDAGRDLRVGKRPDRQRSLSPRAAARVPSVETASRPRDVHCYNLTPAWITLTWSGHATSTQDSVAARPVGIPSVTAPDAGPHHPAAASPPSPRHRSARWRRASPPRPRRPRLPEVHNGCSSPLPRQHLGAIDTAAKAPSGAT